MNSIYTNFPISYTLERCREYFPLGARLVILKEDSFLQELKLRIVGYYYDYEAMMWRPALKYSNGCWADLNEWLKISCTYEVDFTDMKKPFGEN